MRLRVLSRRRLSNGCWSVMLEARGLRLGWEYEVVLDGCEVRGFSGLLPWPGREVLLIVVGEEPGEYLEVRRLAPVRRLYPA